MTFTRDLVFLATMFLLCLISSCASKEQNNDTLTFVNSSTTKSGGNSPRSSENWICDTILSLDEVKEESKFVDKQSKGERQLSVAIYMYPDKTDNYYWVKAWEDNGDAFATHFNFYVYPKTRKIMFHDTVDDTLLDLQSWRKNYKYFNFK